MSAELLKNVISRREELVKQIESIKTIEKSDFSSDLFAKGHFEIYQKDHGNHSVSLLRIGGVDVLLKITQQLTELRKDLELQLSVIDGRLEIISNIMLGDNDL
jgi:hypothetical protein